jgi:ferrous iron transport protein A
MSAGKRLRRDAGLDESQSHLIISVNRRERSRRWFMSVMTDTLKLSHARKGARGVIVRVGDHARTDEHALELERRLLELGFVEGANVELLHEGLFGRDPIAMKVDDMRVALRRHEAASLTVRFEPAFVAGAEFASEEVPA